MTLYHYCSNAALHSILSTQEIWASDFTLSNDALEGQWIRTVFLKICNEKSVEPHIRSRLIEQLNYTIEFGSAVGFCMSEAGDLLSQWRAYAQNGSGVSIGFNQQYWERLGQIKQERNDEFNASLQKVVYAEAEQREGIADTVDKIIQAANSGAFRLDSLLIPMSDADKTEQEKQLRILMTHFMILIFSIYQLKNPAFAEEKEWRVISHIFPFVKNDKEQIAMDHMSFCPLADRIVPYRPIKIEKLEVTSIQEVVLGPRNITPVAVVESMLRKYGWPSVAVKKSTASYR